MTMGRPASARPLAFSDFLFHGYDRPEEQFATQTRDVYEVATGRPGVDVVRDAVFVPLSHDDRGVAGGLFAADGAPVEAASVSRGGHAHFGTLRCEDLPEPQSTIDVPLLYLGGLNGHFGHFLLESLARSWATLEDGRPTSALLHRLGGRDVSETPFTSLCMRALGVDARRRMIPTAPVRLREVHVPRPAIGLQEFAYAAQREVFLRIGERVGLDAQPETEQPLYLSRAALPDSRRRAVGERAFEQALSDSGFRVFRPEQHDLATQIRVAHRHRYIFGFWGTAFRLAYFSPRHKLTCHFGAEFPKSSFLLDRTVTNAEAWFVKAASSCRLDGRRGKYFDLFAMDVGATLGFLRERGFVDGGAPRPPEPSVREIALEAGYIDPMTRPDAAGDETGGPRDLPARFLGPDARAALEQGRFIADAEARLTRGDALRDDPLQRLAEIDDSWRAQLAAGRAKAQRGDDAGARSALQQAIQLQPESVSAVLELAAVQAADDAAHTLRAALAQAPADERLRDALVERLLEQGDAEGAVRTREEVAGLGASPAATWLALARLHRRLDASGRALDALREAASADPEHVETLFELIPALLLAGEAEEAVPHLSLLRHLRPAEPQPLRWLAQATRRTGRWGAYVAVRREMLVRKLRYAFGRPVR